MSSGARWACSRTFFFSDLSSVGVSILEAGAVTGFSGVTGQGWTGSQSITLSRDPSLHGDVGYLTGNGITFRLFRFGLMSNIITMSAGICNRERLCQVDRQLW